MRLQYCRNGKEREQRAEPGGEGRVPVGEPDCPREYGGSPGDPGQATPAEQGQCRQEYQECAKDRTMALEFGGLIASKCDYAISS